MKNNKAPGNDNIPGELLKYGGDRLTERLHDIIKKIWKTETFPEDWKLSIVTPIHKKGDKLKCENYRGISLLSAGYKIFTTLLKNRLDKYADSLIGEYQAGFRRGRSTTDQLFTVRQLLSKCWEFDVDIYQFYCSSILNRRMTVLTVKNYTQYYWSWESLLK
jgi:hypothetical protein